MIDCNCVYVHICIDCNCICIRIFMRLHIHVNLLFQSKGKYSGGEYSGDSPFTRAAADLQGEVDMKWMSNYSKATSILQMSLDMKYTYDTIV